MDNTKQLYKLNGKKFIEKCKSENISPNFEWAYKNNGGLVKFNDKIKLGSLDGKLIPIDICDEYNGAYTTEPNTKLEEVLHKTALSAIEDLYEAEEVIEELADKLEKVEDFATQLMEYHDKFISVIHKHRKSLSEEFIEDMFKDVFSKVLTLIIEK